MGLEGLNHAAAWLSQTLVRISVRMGRVRDDSAKYAKLSKELGIKIN
jgi:hypothetical protein